MLLLKSKYYNNRFNYTLKWKQGFGTFGPTLELSFVPRSHQLTGKVFSWIIFSIPSKYWHDTLELVLFTCNISCGFSLSKYFMYCFLALKIHLQSYFFYNSIKEVLQDPFELFRDVMEHEKDLNTHRNYNCDIKSALI